MTNTLLGKVAWVTGAGSGIGQAGALSLAGEGMHVVLSGRRREPLEETAAMIAKAGGAASVAPVDIADAVGIDAVVQAIQAEHGRLDIVVNSAGLNVPERRWNDLTPEKVDTVLGADLNGAFYCACSVLPIMREQGDGLIINISSWAGRHASYVTGPAYVAAKHAMVVMTHSINQEQCRYGIRACVICPAEVATPILDRRPVPVSQKKRDRMLQSEDLGQTILFVARMPAHVCVNEIVISPTWNRGFLGSTDHYPPLPDHDLDTI